MIFTSHRWGEVANLADRITIFRNGEPRRDARAAAEGEAVTLMTGRTIDRMYPEQPAVADDAEAVLETERPAAASGSSGVSFTLRRGEILGVGGLAGQGQRDLFMTLFGARRSARGDASSCAAGARASGSRQTRSGTGWGSRSSPRTARPRG